MQFMVAVEISRLLKEVQQASAAREGGCLHISKVLRPNTRRLCHPFVGGQREDSWDGDNSWNGKIRIIKIGGLLPRRYESYVRMVHRFRYHSVPAGVMTEDDAEEPFSVYQTAEPLSNGGSVESISPKWEQVTIGSVMPPSLLSEIGRNING